MRTIILSMCVFFGFQCVANGQKFGVENYQTSTSFTALLSDFEMQDFIDLSKDQIRMGSGATNLTPVSQIASGAFSQTTKMQGTGHFSLTTTCTQDGLPQQHPSRL